LISVYTDLYYVVFFPRGSLYNYTDYKFYLKEVSAKINLHFTWLK